MRALRRACRNAAAILIPLAVLSCRSTEGPTGNGRVAPTVVALAVQPVLAADSGAPVIPLRQARIRLFRLPGRIPEEAVLDTLVPFLETDGEREVTLGVTLTMASERFGMELALLDDQGDVVYVGRDTVIAYTSGPPPAAKPLRLRYAGPDTAVVRIELAPSDTVLAIGDPLPLRVAAFLRDGRPTSVRVGFAVHGTSAVSVDASGLLHARAPVGAGAAWVVARTVTGLVDSVSVRAIVPARAIALSPAGGLLTVGRMLALTAELRDSAGAPISGRDPEWRTSDPRVATVSAGQVTGVGVGTAEITATSERASASVEVSVLPGGVARVVPSASRLLLRAGEQATVSAVAFDALGDAIGGGVVGWSTGDAAIARVSPDPAGTGAPSATVSAVGAGLTALTVTIDGVAATIDLEVRRLPAVSVTIAPRPAALRVGESIDLSATARDALGGLVPASEIAWRSLAPLIASVDANGVVRALGVGHAEIVASVDGASDSIRMFVEP